MEATRTHTYTHTRPPLHPPAQYVFNILLSFLLPHDRACTLRPGAMLEAVKHFPRDVLPGELWLYCIFEYFHA